MRLRIWGCRGSVAAPGPETVRYGGNTSCVELRLPDGTVAIFDAGTGIRPLGLQLAEEGVQEIHLFLSHLHLDHLQGLAFFAPLYDPTVRLHIWGPRSPLQQLRERIAVYMSEPLFPVNLSDVPCHATFHDAPEDGVTIGTLVDNSLEGSSATIYAAPVSHQGPTVGYRIESGAFCAAYIPDHEPGLGGDLQTLEAEWMSGYALASGADVLLHDSQYSEEEYPRHVGWGHSSIADVVAFAQRTNIGQLVMFHHEPRHSDEMLEDLRDRAEQLWGSRPHPPVLAYEGMELSSTTISGSRAAGVNRTPAVTGPQ
jgi:phosphoribosyl 1,2-cyclic phosphodiesterase